jgi:hypothetical protein
MADPLSGHSTGGDGGPGLGGTDPFGHPLPPTVDPPPTPPPLDPDTIKQYEMLQEAALNSFAADLSPAKPFADNTLRWDITMPTTVLPGVHPVVRLDVAVTDGPTGYVDDLPPVGSRPATQRAATAYALSLVAPKASRQLGSLTIDLDLSDCRTFALNPFVVTKPVEDQLEAGFPDGGQITFRSPPVVAVHSEAVTVDLALHIDGPAFYNPDANISVAWDLSARGPAWNDQATADARVHCAISVASTSIDVGWADSILSAGVENAVAAAVEGVSDGYLNQLVGPLIAQDIREQVEAIVDTQRPSDWVFHHLDVTPDDLTFWFCPRTAPSPGPGHLPTNHPVLNG